jgi:plastocyanin
MEYVQQVTVEIPSESLGNVQPLVSELEAHREELRRHRGFVDLSVNRSSEPGGNAMLSVETRWRDLDSLLDYTAADRTVERIVESHADVTVPDSMHVRRMEALESHAESRPQVVYERFASALLVPVGIVGIGLAIIYALSRVYLEIGGDAATPLAIAVATGILLVAWYFASNESAPTWQFGSVAVVAAALLVGGTVYAQVSDGPAVHRDEILAGGHETPGAEETPGAVETPGAGGQTVVMDDNVFVVDGNNNPTLTAAANTEVTFQLDNEGAAIHNMHIAATGSFGSGICSAGGDNPCSDPSRIRGGQSGTITFNLPAGTYDYQCDFHVTEMSGTLEVS